MKTHMFLKSRFKRGGVFIVHYVAHYGISVRSSPLALSSFNLKSYAAKIPLQETVAPPLPVPFPFTKTF